MHSIIKKDLNGGHGISRGLFKPFPDFSSKVTLHFVYIALFPSGEFSGAVLSFDLQQVSDGLQPSNVFVAPLSDKDKVLERNTGLYTSGLATMERGPIQPTVLKSYLIEQSRNLFL
jgi:hypothetical protein